MEVGFNTVEFYSTAPVITHCPHGLDMRLHPRCFLCKPLEWPETNVPIPGYTGGGCQCPTSWNGIMRPPCPVHNPTFNISGFISTTEWAMTKYGDTYELHLTPTQALGVALSCGPMTNNIMDEAQAAAILMMEHLEAMGFIVIAASLLMNSHGATVEFNEYLCPNCLTPWKCNGPHISEDRG